MPMPFDEGGVLSAKTATGCCKRGWTAEMRTSGESVFLCHVFSGASRRSKLTFNTRGMTPAVRMTAKAPRGSTHPGASTLPGSATPLAAIRGTTVCNTLVTPAPAAAGSGATIIVVRVGPKARTLDDGGATTNASAEEARQRAAVVAEKSFMSEIVKARLTGIPWVGQPGELLF